MLNNLFNVSGLEKSDSARAMEPVTIVGPADPTPAAAAPSPSEPAPTPVPAAPAAAAEPPTPATPASPAAADPGVTPAADPAAQHTPPAPNDKTDPAAATEPPLPALDPATQAPDGDTEAARQRQQIVLEATEAARRSILQEMGVASMDELRNRITPGPEETPEQKQRRLDLRRAEIQNYAVKKLNMRPDDFVAYQNATEASDEALVFEEFKSKWIPTAQEDPAFKDKDLETEARYMFDQLFHISSENEALRALGARSLKESAEQLRGVHTSNWQRAEQAYDAYRQEVQHMGQFRTVLSQELDKVPAEKKWTLDDGGEVVYQLSKLKKEELERYLVNEGNFKYLIAHGPQKAAELIRNQINAYIAAQFNDEMVNTAIKTTRDITASKAAVGAKAPFQLPVPPVTPPKPSDQLTKEDDAKIAALMRR